MNLIGSYPNSSKTTPSKSLPSPEIADISSPLTTVSGILYNTKKQKNPGVAGSNPTGVQNFFLFFSFSFPKIFFLKVSRPEKKRVQGCQTFWKM